MKILFVIENFHPKVGGLEKLFKTLTDALSSSGHQVTILTNGSGLGLPWKTKAKKVTIYRLPFFNRYLFTLLATLPAFFLARQSDLIHTTSYNAGLPAYLAAKLARRPCMITFHEVWGQLWLNLPFFPKWSLKLHKKFEQFLLALKFDQFVGPSDATVQSLRQAGVSSSRTRRIYNGISYALERKVFTAKANTPFRFLYFGRLGISKGLDLLLPAAKMLADREIPFELTLVVPAKPKMLFEWIEASIQKDQLHQIQIRHDLSDDELQETIRCVDAVVLPSYSEGFCFAAVETMAIGTPLIASMGGALPEVIGGRHIIYKEQTVSALADAMQSATEGKWSESPSRRFSLDSTVQEYSNLYVEMLSEN